MVTRSFKIAWRYKYLWLLALFSGEAGGSLNFGQGPSTTPRSTGNPRDIVYFHAFSQAEIDWVTSHIALLVAGALVSVVLGILFFVLAAVCEGAVVRGAAEHDADRPFGLRIAWRCGLATMGTILRLRLLIIALAFPAVIVLTALAAGFVWALANSNFGAAIGLGLLGLLVFLAVIPYALYLTFLGHLGTRAAVLDQLPAARAALARAHHLLRKRLGRVLLVWLVTFVIGFVVEICLLIPTTLVILPVALIGFATYSSGGPAFWVLMTFALLILLPVFVVIAAFMAAQVSTYWTLAYRRLEIDQVPAYAYAYSPQPAAPPAAPST